MSTTNPCLIPAAGTQVGQVAKLSEEQEGAHRQDEKEGVVVVSQSRINAPPTDK